MYIKKEIEILKKEMVDKTDAAFRVLKKSDSDGEHIVIYVERDSEDKIIIDKSNYSSRIIICKTNIGYLSSFYP